MVKKWMPQYQGKKITKTPSISTLKLTNQSPIISPYPDLPRMRCFSWRPTPENLSSPLSHCWSLITSNVYQSFPHFWLQSLWIIHSITSLPSTEALSPLSSTTKMISILSACILWILRNSSGQMRNIPYPGKSADTFPPWLPWEKNCTRKPCHSFISTWSPAECHCLYWNTAGRKNCWWYRIYNRSYWNWSWVIFPARLPQEWPATVRMPGSPFPHNLKNPAGDSNIPL